MISKRKEEDLYKFAERGDIDSFMNALPDGRNAKGTTSAMGILKKAQGSISSFLKKDFDINAHNNNGYTLLHVSSLNGQHEFVEKLISLGAMCNPKDMSGNTPLHLATWGGHPSVVTVLLQNAASINEMNLEGNTALHFAAQFGKDRKCAQVLMEKGANPLIRNRIYETPLDLASRFGKTELVNILANSEVLAQIYRSGERPRSSPLHLAARNGHREVCKILLANGVNIDILNAEGATPLHEATQFGKKDVVLFLLQNGANPKITNDISQTPLELFQLFNSNAQGNLIPTLLIAAMNETPRDQLASLVVSSSNSTVAQFVPSVHKSYIKAKATISSSGSAYDSSVLCFQEGDIIIVEEQGDSGWWKGRLEKDGTKGEFKANYVEIISEDMVEESSTVPPLTTQFGNTQAPKVQNGNTNTRESQEVLDMLDIPMVTLNTSVEQWLFSLKLERYLPNFVVNKYDQLIKVREMDAEKLEAIGITLAGHRKKLLVAISRLPREEIKRSKSALLDDILNQLDPELLKSGAEFKKPATISIQSLPKPPPPLSLSNLPPPPKLNASKGPKSPVTPTNNSSKIAVTKDDATFDEMFNGVQNMVAEVQAQLGGS